MKRTMRLIGLAAMLTAASACGDVVRQSRSPVLLVMDSLQGAQGAHPQTFTGNLLSDVITNVITGGNCSQAAPCPTFFNDEGQAVIHIVPKDLAVAPTSNNAVTLNRVHVEYVRSDGRNTPGVDVPYPFDGAVTVTIPPSGQAATVVFLLVRNVAKEEPPLVQLVSSLNILTTIANVTFFGRDAVGNDISVSGSIQIDFGNFGDS
jgi:hypothetical protein